VHKLLTIDSGQQYAFATVYSAMGHIVEKVSLTDDQSLRLSGYLPGIYLLVVQSDTGASEMTKLIKY